MAEYNHQTDPYDYQILDDISMTEYHHQRDPHDSQISDTSSTDYNHQREPHDYQILDTSMTEYHHQIDPHDSQISDTSSTEYHHQRDPHNYQILDYETFLHTYRYNLANVIEVKHAIPWLMHNDILDKQDEEKILRNYETSVLRAGDLIDIVNRRGPRAFNALMEFIEYEYPDIFKTMMGTAAREPDPKVYVPAWKKSTRVSEIIASGIDTILKAFDGSRLMRNQAQESVKELEEKIQDVENQLEMKREQILDLTQKVLELGTCNKELLKQLQHVKDERAEAVRKQELFRHERDKYCCEVHRQKEKLMKDLLQQMKNPCDSIIGVNTKSEAMHQNKTHYPSEGNELKNLRINICMLKKENEQLIDDNTCLQDQLVKLGDEHDQLRNSIIDQMKRVTVERDQVHHQFENLKQKYENLQEQNNTLKTKLLTDESTIRIFKTENSIRITRNTVKAKKQRENDTDAISTSMNDIKTSKCSRTDQDDPCHQAPKTSDTILRKGSGGNSGKVRETRLKELVMDSVLWQENGNTILITELLFQNMRKHQGEKKHALVLFAPDPLQFDLYRHLLNEYSYCFTGCPYEVLYDKHLEILPKWLEAGRCIHYRSLGEGRHFCLGSDILQTILHSDSAGQVLLDVPVEALPRMMQQNISIYVLVIKYKHLEKEGKKTEEEQKIEKICQDYVCHYEKLLIDQNSSIDSVASMIVHNSPT